MTTSKMHPLKPMLAQWTSKILSYLFSLLMHILSQLGILKVLLKALHTPVLRVDCSTRLCLLDPFRGPVSLNISLQE